MSDSILRSVGLVFCTLPIVAASAASDDWWPESRDMAIAESCSAIPGIALSYYDIPTTPWDMYVSSDICFDPEDGNLLVTETIEGLQQTMDLGAGSVRLEVIEDADRAHRRRFVMAVPVPMLMDSETTGFASEPFDLYKLSFNVPSDRIELYPGQTQLRGEAFAFRKPRGDIEALPEGRWLVSVAATPSKGPEGVKQVTHKAVRSSATILIGVTPKGAEVLGITSRQRDPDFSMSVSAGKISGSLSYAFDNELLPAARAPREWASAEFQVGTFKGQYIQIGDTLSFVAHGVGRTVLFGENGETTVLGQGASIIGYFVPEQISDETALQTFDFQ